MPSQDQVASIWGETMGYVDDVPVAKVRAFEKEFVEFLEVSAPEVLRGIKETNTLSDDAKAALKANIAAFKEGFMADLTAPAGA